MRAAYPLSRLTRLGLVPRLQAPGAVEVEAALAWFALRHKRLEQERVVVAGVHPAENTPREPVAALLENRCPGGARAPATALELVDVVPRLGTEELHEPRRILRHKVHHHHLGILLRRDPVGP